MAATILALLPLTATAATAPSRPAARAGAAAPAKCDQFGRMQQAVGLQPQAPRAQRLDQLPPGDLHLTVERQIEGCHQPVIVRQNFGGAAFRGR
jgi:hypothetical protein